MPTTVSHERAGYLDTSPIDLGENTRRDIILTLEEMGYQITSSHHEIAPAQHEIDFAFEDALSTADKVMTFKMAVRTIAKRYGLHATFMPEPRQDVMVPVCICTCGFLRTAEMCLPVKTVN